MGQNSIRKIFILYYADMHTHTHARGKSQTKTKESPNRHLSRRLHVPSTVGTRDEMTKRRRRRRRMRRRRRRGMQNLVGLLFLR